MFHQSNHWHRSFSFAVSLQGRYPATRHTALHLLHTIQWIIRKFSVPSQWLVMIFFDKQSIDPDVQECEKGSRAKKTNAENDYEFHLEIWFIQNRHRWAVFPWWLEHNTEQVFMFNRFYDHHSVKTRSSVVSQLQVLIARNKADLRNIFDQKRICLAKEWNVSSIFVGDNDMKISTLHFAAVQWVFLIL